MARREIKPPTPPRAPRLRLSPIRSQGSVSLDRQIVPVTRTRNIEIPPFIRWDQFYDGFAGAKPWAWKQGEHITLIGTTGSGKTTLARQLLALRDYVIVLATKQRDPSLYAPLTKAGFKIVSNVDQVGLGEGQSGPRVIFRPGLTEPTRAAMQEQAEAFARLLVTVYDTGCWTLYGDEIRYITDNLGLKTEMETLWLQGRSLDVSIVAATQRPVSIPLLAFDQATHLFLWRNADRESVRRMSEFAGSSQETVAETIQRLPEHECLYVHTRQDVLLRTRVIL